MAKLTTASAALLASVVGPLWLSSRLPLADAAGTGYVSTSGTQILDEDGNDLFFSGINLGNWLVWEGYLMMGDFNYRTHTQFFNELAGALGGTDKAAEFEYQWRLNYVDEKAIADLAGLGFNSVRVPFNFKLFYRDGQIVDDGFEFFDRVIGWCRTHGMYVLLDMHGAPGYQNPGDHADNVDSNANQPRDTVKFWDGSNVQLAASIWKHIASRYADEPVVWGYDLINEPVPQAGREYELLPSFVTMANAIREVDNNHIVVAEGSWWGSDLTKIDWLDSQVQSQTGITAQWDDKLVYQIHHYGPASGTFGREQITNNLNIPLFIGEYGETDEGNLQAITDWAKGTLEGYFPWSFKKMSHDRTLWTIPPNDAYNQVKAYINNGGSNPPTHLYDAMIDFAQNNVRNGHSSHEWHQGFYNAIKPSITCAEAASFSVPGQIEAENYCAHYGVQVETTTDSGGGQNIGFLDSGDYTEYNIDVGTGGQYVLSARVASQESSGQIDVQVDGTSLATLSVPNTNGWQSFTTITAVLSLSAGTHRLRLAFPGGSFNLNWISFALSDGTAPTPSPVASPQTGCDAASGFAVPGKIEAENYCDHSGVETEPTSDTGGGQNIGFLDPGDYAEYNIDVGAGGQYSLEVRVASDWDTGELDVKVDGASVATYVIGGTGGWQSFVTLSSTVTLAAGSHRLRLEFPGGHFNLNWLNFAALSGPSPTDAPTGSPVAPTIAPVPKPTESPTEGPTSAPVDPTELPTKAPTAPPSSIPTKSPVEPTDAPTSAPTKSPTKPPTSPPVDPGAGCGASPGFAVPGYLQAEQYCDQQGVVAETTSDTGGGQHLAQLDNGDYAEYDINVAASGPYTFAARVESSVYSGQINLQVDGISVLWLSVPHTNGGWSTITATVHNMSAGTHRLRVASPQGGFKLNWMAFASGSNQPAPPPPPSGPVSTPAPVAPAPTPQPVAPPTNSPVNYTPTSSPLAPSPSPTQCDESADCDDSDECTYDVCTGGQLCEHSSGACEAVGKICDGSGLCVDPPTSTPTGVPTKSPVVPPTPNPPPPPPPTPSGGLDCASASAFAIPGNFEAESYCDMQGVTAVDASGSSGGKIVTGIDNGDYIEYNVAVSTSSQYTFAAVVKSPVYSGQINLQLNGQSVLWLSVPHTNGNWQTVFANVWMNAGTYELRVAFPQGGFEADRIYFNAGANNPP